MSTDTPTPERGSISVNARVYPTRGTWGITCFQYGCQFDGWGWAQDAVMERLAEHAETECPWTPESGEAPGG